MRICLMIEGQEAVTWEQWLALGRACEDGGLEGLFRSDHYTSVFGALERGSLDAWTTLAGIAAHTTRIRLGTMVSPATFRHPSLLARSVATVDHISGGRVELGLGAGWYELEHRAHGFEFDEHGARLDRFAEQLEMVHRQWTEETFDFSGRYYQLEDCRALPKPLQRPRPPIVVGGTAKPGTLGPAIRFADEYNTPLASLEQCVQRRGRLVAACEAAGRDPATLPFSLMTTCIVAEDRATLRERARGVMRVTGDDGDPDAFLAAAPAAWVAGTVDEVVDQLRALEATGVERIMLQHLAHDDLESVALIGERIVPALRG
jgi:F420-dependent oxidoreductase-like protein